MVWTIATKQLYRPLQGHIYMPSINLCQNRIPATTISRLEDKRAKLALIS